MNKVTMEMIVSEQEFEVNNVVESMNKLNILKPSSFDVPMSEQTPLQFELYSKPLNSISPSFTANAVAFSACVHQKRKQDQKPEGNNSYETDLLLSFKRMKFTVSPKSSLKMSDQHELSQCPQKMEFTLGLQLHPSAEQKGNSTSAASESSRNQRTVERIVHLQSPPAPPVQELPLDYQKKISELGGTDIRFVIGKRLYESDVSPGMSRLNMPWRQCKADLTSMQQTQVKVIQLSDSLSPVIMGFLKSDTLLSYVFQGSWNTIVQDSNLKAGDFIQIWSFNQGDELSFALLKLN